MFNLKTQAEAFKLNYEKFLTACDALEEEKRWDTEKYGEMESWYFNDIMCVIIHLISSDGSFSRKEADYVNDVFGFGYTAAELAELYRVQGEDINRLILEDVPANYQLLKGFDGELAELYKTLLLQVCGIVADSDGVLHDSERKLIDGLKAKLV